MYGFGGVGQVEVRFGQMSPWRDERTTNRTNKQGKIGLLSHGPWKAEMSNDMSALNIPNKLGKCQFLEETEKFLYVLNILHTKHVCLADVLTQI